MAKQDTEMFIPQINNLARQPGDPHYLTLYYRLRELYFSVDSHPPHAVIFLGDNITDDGDKPKLFPYSRAENRGLHLNEAGYRKLLAAPAPIKEDPCCNPRQIYPMTKPL